MEATIENITSGAEDGLTKVHLTLSADEAGDAFLLAGQSVGGFLSEEGEQRSDTFLKNLCETLYGTGVLEDENLSKAEWAAHMAVKFHRSRALLVGLLADFEGSPGPDWLRRRVSHLWARRAARPAHAERPQRLTVQPPTARRRFAAHLLPGPGAPSSQPDSVQW